MNEILPLPAESAPPTRQLLDSLRDRPLAILAGFASGILLIAFLGFGVAFLPTIPAETSARLLKAAPILAVLAIALFGIGGLADLVRPRRKGRQTADGTPRSGDPRTVPSPTKGTALVVVSASDGRCALHAALENIGWVVEEASDSDALRELLDPSIDVVFLETKLEGESTRDLLPEIRELNSRAEVVMVTDPAGAKDGLEALMLGAFEIVTRPIDPDRIAKVARRALRSSAQELPEAA